MSLLKRLTREQKKRAMIRYLTQQGTLFNSFLDSSEEKARARAKTKAAASRGKYALFALTSLMIN